MIDHGIFKSKCFSESTREAARDWVELMLGERDLTTSERERFNKWLFDVNNERAYVAELEIYCRLAEVRGTHPEAFCCEVATMASTRYQVSRSSWTRLSLAGAVVVALVGLGALWTEPSRQNYRTEIGEKRSTQLVDGTRVDLSSQTELEWLGTGQCDRRVRLLHGEALFRIHDDPKCPFRISVARGSIEVLGTAFDVHQSVDGEERVSVLNGRVRIHGSSGSPPWQMDLGAGQQATWSAGLARTRRLDDLSEVTAWRDDKLDFEEQPLAEVVEELRRFTAVPIRIADSQLLSTHVTGELQVDEPHMRASLMRIAQPLGIEVRDDGKALVLTSRR